jgi:hypothetical protein
MGKSETARQVVAGRLFGAAVGERIPTTAELAGAAEVGYGTIAGVLKSLSDDGIVTVTTHGAQGSRLVSRDAVRLWRAAGRGPLLGVLPLPASPEFSGLATAVTVLAERWDLPVQLLYRQGAGERFEFLRTGQVDWIGASKGARRISGAGVAHRTLAPFTYYGRNAVVVITAVGCEPKPRGRVPIDRRSYDHTALTEAEFPDATYVETPYLAIPEMVVAGEVDAAVWHQTSSSPLLVATGLEIHPLRRPSPADADGSSCAALYWRVDDVAAATLIDEVLRPEDVQRIQQEVIAGERMPQY